MAGSSVRQKPSFRRTLCVCLLLLAILAVFLRNHAGICVSSSGYRCPFYALTGLHCLGCGGTRAFDALLAGDFAGAFYYHPLFFATALAGVLLFTRYAWRAFRGGPPARRKPFGTAKGILLALGLLSFWIVRNLPFYQAVFF